MTVEVFLYWGPRKADIGPLAAQLKEHFEVLLQAGEALSWWAPLGRSFSKAMASELTNVVSVEALHGLLLKGRNKTDIAPRKPIPELGYRVTLWNQRHGGIEAQTTIACGVFSNHLSQDSQNHALLRWNTVGEQPPSPLDPLALFEQLIHVWKPAWGHVSRRMPEDFSLEDREPIQHAFYSSHIGFGFARQIGEMRRTQTGGYLWVNHAGDGLVVD